MIRSLLLLAQVLVLSGCFRTVSEIRAQGDLDQTVPPPRRQAPVTSASEAEPTVSAAAPAHSAPVTTASRFEEVDEQLRAFNGRLEVVEQKLNEWGSARLGAQADESKEKEIREQKFLAYEEELKRLTGLVQSLTEEVNRLKPVAKTPTPAPAVAKGSAAYDEGEKQLNGKNWKEAIVAFQKYRDANPKGKMYADATYKIGLAFQEMGLKDEARTFFEEVTSKFPGSKESKKAAQRLKTLR